METSSWREMAERRGLAPTFRGALCYTDAMTRDQVKEILDRVLSWPADDQEGDYAVLDTIP